MTYAGDSGSPIFAYSKKEGLRVVGVHASKNIVPSQNVSFATGYLFSRTSDFTTQSLQQQKTGSPVQTQTTAIVIDSNAQRKKSDSSKRKSK